MAAENKAKITYLTQKLCVAVKTTRAEWHPDGLKPLEDILLRANKKLEGEKTAGNIIDFIVEEKQLVDAWEKIALHDPKSTTELYIPFAFGIKDFAGVTLEKSTSPGSCCLITVRTPLEEVKAWNVNVLSNFIKYKVVKNQWGEAEPEVTQLKEIQSILLKGVKVERVPVSARKQAKVATGAPPAAKKVPAPTSIAPPPMKAAPVAATKTNGQDIPDIIDSVPAPVAAAPTASTPTAKAATPEAQPLAILESIAVPDEYVGKGWIQIQINPDKMGAEIIDFDIAHYTEEGVVLDDIWLKREIKRHGILLSNPELLHRAVVQMRGKKPLKGLKIAQGIEGTAAASPGLQPIPPKSADSKAGDGSSLRQTKTIPFYRKGDIVAEILYKVPERTGLDVLGGSLPAPPKPPYKAELGDGIKQTGQAFEALRDGLLKVETDKIDIIQSYVHQGNVSIVSGNLDFDGAIIITGDIDAGCSVTARGDLEVHGSIRAADVRCFGNLKVNGGINTGMKNSVRVGAGVTADYIENSVVYCKEDIKVRKALLSSKVFCGSSILLSNSDAHLAGGEIYFQNQINTASIGFSTGAATRIYMGTDWRDAIREHILVNRLANLEAHVEKCKAELREVLRKNPGQMTSKHRLIVESHKTKITKGRKLIDKVMARHKKLRDSLKINDNATVTVRMGLAGDVQFLINGTTVLGDSSLSEFTVRTKAVNNTHFSKMKDAAEAAKAAKKTAADTAAAKESPPKGKEAAPKDAAPAKDSPPPAAQKKSA